MRALSIIPAAAAVLGEDAKAAAMKWGNALPEEQGLVLVENFNDTAFEELRTGTFTAPTGGSRWDSRK